MRRRTLLEAVGTGVGAAALPVAGVGAAAAEPYAPLGAVRLDDAAEAVVGPDGTTAYVATVDGFAAVDVSDPRDPGVLAERSSLAADHEDGPMETIWDVKVDGDRLLVVGPAGGDREPRGLFVFDVSDPADPRVEVDLFETGFSIHNAFLRDGYAYLSSATFGSGITVVDVTADPPETVGTWTPYDADVGVDGWDDASEFPMSCHDLAVYGDLAYCAYWDAGVWVVDVSDPAAPEYVSHLGDYSLPELVEFARGGESEWPSALEPPGNAHFVTVDDDRSLLGVGGESWEYEETDREGGPSGIDLYDVSDPRTPERLATIDPPRAANETLDGYYTTAHNFDLHGDRLYSAWYRAGVKVHDVSDPRNPEQLAWWREPAETRFWTARLARPGEFFVASSNGRGEPAAALYTFPDRAGQQADPPQSVWPEGERPTTTTTATTTTATTTTTTAGSPTGATTTTASATTTRETTPTSARTDSTTAETPGVGVLGALGGIGLGIAAWRSLRDGDGEA